MDLSALKFAESHEWARLDGGLVTVGLSPFAISQLSDLVLVELPRVGARVTAGKSFGIVESVKSVNDLYAPVSGEVAEVNRGLESDIGALSSDSAYGAGWLIKVRADDPAEMDRLISHDAYQAMTSES